jgi:hypothetical protein
MRLLSSLDMPTSERQVQGRVREGQVVESFITSMNFPEADARFHQMRM